MQTKKNTIFKGVAVLLVCTLLTGLANPTMSEAATKIIKSCTINGTKRSLEIDSNNWVAYRIFIEYHVLDCVKDEGDIGIDRNGAIWKLDSYNNGICWYSYDMTPKDDPGTFRQIIKDGFPIDDVESLVRDDDNFVIGYKTLSGETKPILTFEEMKNILYPDGIIPATAPIKLMGKSEVSVNKNFDCMELYVSGSLYSRYDLKKNVLTYNGLKVLKVKKVKSAAYEKESNSLLYMTKAGKVYSVSLNGKKKLIAKNAKKFICKDGFVVKITKKNGKTINVTSLL